MCYMFSLFFPFEQEVVLSHPAAIKALTAGRVIVISNSFHSNQLGIVLTSTMAANNERVFTSLVLCDKNKSVKVQSEERQEAEVRPVTDRDLYLPAAPCGHDLIQVKAKDVSTVTVKSIRVEATKIIDDIKKRQMTRFKYFTNESSNFPVNYILAVTIFSHFDSGCTST